jgi:energy-coupling factor transport system substrate-specific component
MVDHRQDVRVAGRRGFAPGFGVSWWLLAVASAIGLAAFLYPFLLPAVARQPEGAARAEIAPLLLALVTALALLALAADAGGRSSVSASKSVALLGMLVATDAALRLAPSVAGGSPIFLLIMLAGAAYGPAFGFQMGTMTLLVSAFLTGGIGPWLPFQMIAAGWIGLTAGWLPRRWPPRRRIAALAVFGAVWGFGYGLLLNLWFWPVIAPGAGADASLYWLPGLEVGEAIGRYARFYLVTSAWHDAFRAGANALLILLLGRPLLMLLERFRGRFEWRPWSELEETRAI